MTPPSPMPAAGNPPTAVLYLPPILNLHQDEDELATIGRKLAFSLDKFAADNAAIYESRPATVTIREREVRVCRLTRRLRPTDEPLPIADLFLLDYRPTLMERYRKANLIGQVILAALGLIVMGAKGLRALGRQPFRVKRLRDRLQALYALACFSIVFAYLGLLLLTMLAVVHNTIDQSKRGGTTGTAATNTAPAAPLTNMDRPEFGQPWPGLPIIPSTPDSQSWRTAPELVEPFFPPSALPFWHTNGRPSGPVWIFPASEAESTPGESSPEALWRMMTAPVRVVWEMPAADTGLLLLVLTGLGLAGGRGGENRLRAFITRASEEMLASIYYLSFTDRRAEITGQFDAQLEAIMETGAYGRSIVMGFSFGTVVALDAFCPASDVRARGLGQVETLATIATPYDFILTYWPRYFADRQHQPPPRWLNVYSPVDLLGTCFDKRKARAERARRVGVEETPAAPPSRDALQNSFGRAGQLATGPTEEFAYREGVPDEQLGVLGWVAMQGLGAHSRYWAKGEDGERNCFDLLVKGLFPDEFQAPPNGTPAVPPFQSAGMLEVGCPS